MYKKALLFGIGLLLPFAVGEAVLQWIDPYHFGEKEDWTRYAGRIMDWSRHRLRPGAVATYLGRKTVISSQGWRSPEFVVDKPPDVFRILLLGGSVPFGWGVEQGDEFPRLLERQLNAAKLAGDRRIEVINTGVPGWKIADAGRFLQAEGRGYRPDMVLLTLVATDVPMPRFDGSRGELFDDSIRQLRLARAFENRYRFGAPGSQGKPYDAYADLSADGLAVVNVLLGEFQRVCAGAGARLVVFDTLGRAATKARCAALGVHRIDGFTSWAQRRSWEVAVTDAHPDAVGHRVLAGKILAGLQAKSLWGPK